MRKIIFVLYGVFFGCSEGKIYEGGIALSPDFRELKIADQLDNEATGFEDIFSDIFFIPIYLEDSSYLS